MELKSAAKKRLPLKAIKNFSRSKRKLKWTLVFVLGFMVLFITALGSTYYGMVLYKTGEGDGFIELLKYGLDDRLNIVPNFFRGLVANPERILIDIKQADYQKLAYKRFQAMERSNLFASPDDFVPAEIRYNGETTKVALRIKGDNRDHWKNKTKWSFRIEVKGDNTLFGMKHFSIQHPRTRSYINEWFYHKLLAYNDLIHLRYDFIDVTLNGKHLGIYAIEEHFEKRLVENNQYREGPILRYDSYSASGQNYSIPFYEAYSIGVIDAFQTGKIKKDEELSRQFNVAKNLLESFKRGLLSVHEVFDIDKMAKIYALAELSGQMHTLAASNIRFYYNPVTGLLEPIGYDNQRIEPIIGAINGEHKQLELSLLDKTDEMDLQETFFKDKEFFEKYIEYLEIVSKKEYLDQFFAETEPEYKEKIAILYKSFPGYKFEAKEILYENQDFVRRVLNPDLALQAYYKDFNEYNNSFSIDIGNMQRLPLEILGLGYKNSIIKPNEETILQAKKLNSAMNFQTITFALPGNVQFSKDAIEEFTVHYKLLGLNNIRTEPIFPWTYLDQDFQETDFIRQAPNWQGFPFLSTNWQTEVISIKKGYWEINRNLIIPAGFVVVAGEGVRLNLTNSAKILSYSPLKFQGEAYNPIIIESNNSTGQGIIVMLTEGKSFLENVIFRNLSAPLQGDWRLLGAVNFYESPVEILNCGFESNHSSDDYLNIIRTEFIIENSYFKDSFADAIDLDFSKGRILNTSFINVGIKDGNGDGIDFSGSVVSLESVIIDSAGDKALSIGENSHVTAEQIEIKNANIAVAVKDLSTLNIKDLIISDSKVGFAVFQKKSEFGPAELTVENFSQSNVVEPYLLEQNSRLIIDNEKIEPNAENLATTLY